ncbi:MAG: hypothetical protein EOO50_16995 [Flavobacterium sp.]|nr:MAG: hypothetical protein EOO50_16995 [Flavobacterium sp.]
MKVGSYVYNLNRVIYNMLYENEGYDNALASWSSRSGYFNIVSWFAVWYNRGVQFTLRSVYRIVNKNYMALSREMEFHADAIAVKAVGTNPMISSMLRMDMASQAMSRVLGQYDNRIKESIFTDNIFPRHEHMMNFIAQTNRIPFQNNLPDIEQGLGSKSAVSKLNIEDQWSSHPSDEDRIAEFRRANVADIDPDTTSARSLFTDIESTQRQITKNIFSGIAYPDTPKTDELEDFHTIITNNYLANKFPDAFNGHYDQHNPEPFDVKTWVAQPDNHSAAVLFGNEAVGMIGVRNAMRADSENLKSIAENPADLKTFDYDGVKYRASQARDLHKKLEQEIALLNETIDKNDKRIFNHFYNLAKASSSEYRLLTVYRNFFDLDSAYEVNVSIFVDMKNNFSFAYEVQQPDVIRAKMQVFLRSEKTFQAKLKEIVNNPLFESAMKGEARIAFNDYLSAGHFEYFSRDKYDNEAIEVMNKAVDFYLEVLQQSYFDAKKTMLDYKAQLLENA